MIRVSPNSPETVAAACLSRSLNKFTRRALGPRRVGSEMKFANYSCGALPATSRIGFLMCHADDLIRSMKE